MKTLQEVQKQLYATLAELEHGVENENLKRYLQIKLKILYNDVLDEEDVQEEYWERIEAQI